MQTFRTSKSREKILSRIRNGLNKSKAEMPFPEAEQQAATAIYRTPELSLEETFADEFSRLGGKFVFCAHEQEFLENVHSLIDQRGWKDVLCAESRFLEMFQNNRIPFVNDLSPDNSTAEACITGCETLVARTGSVILSSRQRFGRVSSVFYPVHIIVAYHSQLVFDIEDGLRFITQQYEGQVPSMINLNTGPSRTADIEKTLVVGVHGPGEVFCFYIND